MRRDRVGPGEPDQHWTVERVRALGVRTDLVTAGQILGIGRGKAYELASTGEFPVPVLHVGAKYVVPVQPILLLLGYADEGQP